MNGPNGGRTYALSGLLASIWLLCGCQPSTPATGTAAPVEAAKPATEPSGADKPSDEAAGAEIVLAEGQDEKLGLAVRESKAAQRFDEVGGYAQVLGHDAIAQSVAELSSARAIARQSNAALARAKQLESGDGALPREAREAAERQDSVDAAALALAERRLTTVLGDRPEWQTPAGSQALAELASGHVKLVRVVFPLGTELPAHLSSLRLARIGSAPSAILWHSQLVWPAPVDSSLPGPSYFAQLSGNAPSEGERLVATTPVGKASRGWIVPADAIVQSEGRYWCFVQKAGRSYQRVEVATDKPLADGYFVTDGLATRLPVVIRGAALLLARELNPDSGGSDD